MNNLYECRNDRQSFGSKKFIPKETIERLSRLSMPDSTLPGETDIITASTVSIEEQLQILRNENYCPILLYKSSKDPGTFNEQLIFEDDYLFVLGIQTKEQLSYLEKYAKKIVFIDVSEYYTLRRLSVITLKVLNENDVLLPVAHLITSSREVYHLEAFFYEMKSRCSDDLECHIIMGDDSGLEYMAFQKVFGENIVHVICKWHLHRSWCLKIREEQRSEEQQQQVYLSLVSLLEEKDTQRFEMMITDFVKTFDSSFPNFVLYFINTYSVNPKSWASCYRTNIAYANYDFALYQHRFQKQLRVNKKAKDNNETVGQLLDLLLKIEQKDYIKQILPMTIVSTTNVLLEHVAGINIPSDCIEEDKLTWTLNFDGSTVKVELRSDVCRLDFCVGKCLDFVCFGLCEHLYRCSCKCSIKLCKHMHKIHSLRIGLHSINDVLVVDPEQREIQAQIQIKLNQLSELILNEECSTVALVEINKQLDLAIEKFK